MTKKQIYQSIQDGTIDETINELTSMRIARGIFLLCIGGLIGMSVMYFVLK